MLEHSEEMVFDFDMECEILQPWSTFITKTKLPPIIFEKLLKITDKVSTERKPHGIEQKESEYFKEFHNPDDFKNRWISLVENF